MSIERIIAAVVDTKKLTLYREDGTTIEVPQGDPRIREIIEQVMPVIQNGGIAEVDMSYLPNSYQDFEKQSSGLVRLFRVAKKAVSSLFSRPSEEDIEEMFQAGGSFGPVPVSTATPIVTMGAIEEILEQAQPVSDPEFKEADTTEDHTMIAVVADKDTGQKTVIPGVESIKEQFAYAGGKNATGGMERFLARVSKVIADRPHSVEDLLRFLEKGDLPIADDGSIIAYKRLCSRDDTFVDPHTKKVTQQPGSYVCVDKSLVDLSRRNECSNGLHIGRRGYMGSFNGDTIMICKIAPEDVMVVPHNDPNKVRVCGYHIIARVNEAAFRLICSNKPPSNDPETAKLISDVVAGKHAPAFEEVKVTQQYGGGLQIRQLDPKKAQNFTPEGVPGRHVNGTEKPKPKPEIKHHSLDDGVVATADPKNVAEKVSAAKQTVSRKDKAQALLAKAKNTNDVAVAAELVALKKASKVSWDLLGISEADVEFVTEQAKVADTKPATASAAAVVTPPKAEQASVAKAKGERAQKIEAFECVMKDTSKHHSVRFNAGQDLIAFRKRSKVSWEKLGRPDLSDAGITTYINNIPKAEVKPTAVPKAKPKAPPVKAEPKPTTVTVAEAPKVGSSQTEARRLYGSKNWKGLAALKKIKKKSWSALGFTSEEEAHIKKQLGN